MNPYAYSAIGSIAAAIITAVAVVLAARLQRGQKRLEETVETLKPNHGESVADKVSQSVETTRQLHGEIGALRDLLHVLVGHVEQQGVRLEEHGHRLDEHITGASEDRRHIFAVLASLRRHDHERKTG